MWVGSSDNHIVPQLRIEGYVYVGIIMLAFCGLATQKLVHYPVGVMAVAGIVLFCLHMVSVCWIDWIVWMDWID